MRLLFLAHRLPWPPDKGERIRALALLRHLASRFDVTLAAPDDEGGGRVPAELRQLCREVLTVPLTPVHRYGRMLTALLRGRALSLAVFTDPRLRQKLQALAPPDLVVACSTATAAWIPVSWRMPILFDMVDVDSAKWHALAALARDPLRRWLFAREAALVAAAEARAAARAQRVLLVAERERALFARRHPEFEARLRVVPNGVDPTAFDEPLPDPFAGETAAPLVFVGRMDYPPNVAGARFLAREVLPRLSARGLNVRLHLVGAAPVRAVRRLGGPHVRVWGRVADVRPFHRHARIALVPLAVARGVQNKLLEALAAGRPVVATPAAVAGLPPGAEAVVRVAEGGEAFAAAIAELLADRAGAEALGAAARRFAVDRLGWARAFSALDAAVAEVLDARAALRPMPAPAGHWPPR